MFLLLILPCFNVSLSIPLIFLSQAFFFPFCSFVTYLFLLFLIFILPQCPFLLSLPLFPFSSSVSISSSFSHYFHPYPFLTSSPPPVPCSLRKTSSVPSSYCSAIFAFSCPCLFSSSFFSPTFSPPPPPPPFPSSSPPQTG